MGKYEPKKVYYDTPTITRDVSPYHKFLRERNEFRIAMKTNIPQSGYMWGYDERSIKDTLGDNWEYYFEHFGTSKKHHMAFVMGTAMYAFRRMYGLGALCWITEFGAGLIQLKTGLPVLIPTVLIWHALCWFHFEDSFFIKMFKAYRKAVPTYKPITEEANRRLHGQLGVNPFMAAVYIAIEAAVVVLMFLLCNLVE